MCMPYTGACCSTGRNKKVTDLPPTSPSHRFLAGPSVFWAACIFQPMSGAPLCEISLAIVRLAWQRQIIKQLKARFSGHNIVWQPPEHMPDWDAARRPQRACQRHHRPDWRHIYKLCHFWKVCTVRASFLFPAGHVSSPQAAAVMLPYRLVLASLLAEHGLVEAAAQQAAAVTGALNALGSKLPAGLLLSRNQSNELCLRLQRHAQVSPLDHPGNQHYASDSPTMPPLVFLEQLPFCLPCRLKDCSRYSACAIIMLMLQC